MAAQTPVERATEITRICRRKVVTIAPDADISEAARLMRSQHIGFLVVCEPAGGMAARARVTGVLTDRDIVVAVIARDADPRALKVADVMTRNPLIVSEDCSLPAALDFMRDTGVRRVPVLGPQDELVGVLALDDVVENLARQLTSIAGAYRGEQRAERTVRP